MEGLAAAASGNRRDQDVCGLRQVKLHADEEIRAQVLVTLAVSAISLLVVIKY